MEEKINVIVAPTIRSLVTKANEKKLTKDAIISIVNDNAQYVLIYC